MPALFFVVAAASSETVGSHEQCASLALHPGSRGWQSARCCSYPQELLLQLERGAEVHEIEIVSRGELAPKAVEVLLSRASREECLRGNPGFEHASTLELHDSRVSGTGLRGSTARTARQKLFGLCSGQVKLLVHEPRTAAPGNPFRQVALTAVHIWGYEDVVVPKPAHVGSKAAAKVELGDGHDEVTAVLMELGVPLSLVPLDEQSMRLTGVDQGTRRLAQELQMRQRKLVQASKFGEAQQVGEHIQQLSTIGQELQGLFLQKEVVLADRDLKEAERLEAAIAALEDKRLHMAALYETNWWLEVMSSRFGVAQRAPPTGHEAPAGTLHDAEFSEAGSSNLAGVQVPQDQAATDPATEHEDIVADPVELPGPEPAEPVESAMLAEPVEHASEQAEASAVGTGAWDAETPPAGSTDAVEAASTSGGT